MPIIEKRCQANEEQMRAEFEASLAIPSRGNETVVLQAAWLGTPKGTMLAVADMDHLHLLSFLAPSGMIRTVDSIRQRLNATIEMGTNPAIESVQDETEQYFNGSRQGFLTPLTLTGTGFQLSVWNELRRIPYGVAISYGELARRIGRPSSCRAVAQANSQNPIHIMIPCHRVINSDGKLGGYAAGIKIKKWLLALEQRNMKEDD